MNAIKAEILDGSSGLTQAFCVLCQRMSCYKSLMEPSLVEKLEKGGLCSKVRF